MNKMFNENIAIHFRIRKLQDQHSPRHMHMHEIYSSVIVPIRSLVNAAMCCRQHSNKHVCREMHQAIRTKWTIIFYAIVSEMHCTCSLCSPPFCIITPKLGVDYMSIEHIPTFEWYFFILCKFVKLISIFPRTNENFLC